MGSKQILKRDTMAQRIQAQRADAPALELLTAWVLMAVVSDRTELSWRAAEWSYINRENYCGVIN